MAETQQGANNFDSGQQYLSNVYAKALLGVTESAGCTEAVISEFDSLIVDVLAKLPNIEAVLVSARVPHADKERMLDKVFRGKMSSQLLTFLKVVSKHGRMDCLRSISKSFHRLNDELRGRVVVYLKTADVIGQDLLKTIAETLNKKLGMQVQLHTTIDPELIGGMVVRVGDTVFDGSVANQLNRFREESLQSTSQTLRSKLDRFVTAG